LSAAWEDGLFVAIFPLHLTDQEKKDLVAFMQALTVLRLMNRTRSFQYMRVWDNRVSIIMVMGSLVFASLVSANPAEVTKVHAERYASGPF